MDNPLISVVVLSHNRPEDLRITLQRVEATNYHPLEIMVIDNASKRGLIEAMAKEFTEVTFVKLRNNLGAFARNIGLERARGEFLVMLDDDSSPLGEALARMVRVFRNDEALGAVAFRVILPDGRDESAGTHNVFVGCGVGFRTEILKKIGGYPRHYRFYVEEYDVSYRLMASGFAVRWFADISVEHRHSKQNRSLNKIIYYLVRNNIWLLVRFFPFCLSVKEIMTLVGRYFLLSLREHVLSGYFLGLIVGILRIPWAMTGKMVLPRATREEILGYESISFKMREIAKSGQTNRVGLLGYNRDTKRYIDAARAAGMEIEAVYDDLLARYRRSYHGVAALPVDRLKNTTAHSLIVTATSPGAGKNYLRLVSEMGVKVEVICFTPYATLDKLEPGSEETGEGHERIQ